MITFILFVTALALVLFLFMHQTSFGRKPSGIRLERIQKSPQYIKGAFQNQHLTPTFTSNGNFFSVLYDFLFGKHERKTPDHVLPSIKRDLHLPAGLQPEITWFGHSSYLIQINGLNILVDPAFSERTSPVSFAGTKAYPGTNVYTVADMPKIDVLVITHDHYDHMDYKTILALKEKVGVIVTSLGVGSHLEYWGFPVEQIKELDWWESTAINAETSFTAAPARHFSGRGVIRNKTLWSSFILKSKDYKLYLGGDSGYDTHFKAIGDAYGPFDLAVLENGQYNLSWANIHLMPEEVAQAAMDLKAKAVLPVHWAKFTLATHAWDEPVSRLVTAAERLALPVITPRIGEKIVLKSVLPNAHWWQKENR